MSRKYALWKRFVTACLLLGCAFCLTMLARQNDAASGASLARIEKSIEAGKIDEVEKTLLEYAVAHPKDARALDLLGRVRQRQGRLEEAGALYRRVLALDASLVRTRINLARVMYDSGEQGEARRLLIEVAQAPSADPEIQLTLAGALLLVGEFQKALATTDKLPLKVKSAEALPIIAASYLALGERQKLSALLPSMRRAAGSQPGVAVRCAEVLTAAGMNEQAIALLRSALEAAPGNTGVLVSLGRLETGARDFVQSRLHLNRAAALDAHSADVLSALSLLESAQGNMAAALAFAEQALALAPDSLPVLEQFVVTAMRANRPQAAFDGASALLKLKPDEPEFLYLFGAASLQGGNLNVAQKALERYVRVRPGDSRGCLALGIAFAGQNEGADAARAQFERCIQLDAANVEAKYQLSLVFKAQGETERAVRLLEDVTTRAPRHADALRDLGALYLQTGDDAKARAVLERAVALNEQDGETHFQLSRLYSRAGETALAARHLDLFQKLKTAKTNGGGP